MEHRIDEPSPSVAPTKDAPQANWRDLREWLALVERNNELLRITKPVSADEELAAITYMATRGEKAPALLFENVEGDKSGARVLANMLGSSKERYALAVGLDPDLSTAEMIAETRVIMSRRIAPRRIPKAQAPVNEVVLRGSDIDLTQFPSPKFWPGDGGRYIGTGDITLTASPDTGRINVGCYRQML
ncbi:MAG TPA: UbiD family decarboxylase, partial [Xanthobacteraceae bacterium]